VIVSPDEAQNEASDCSHASEVSFQPANQALAEAGAFVLFGPGDLLLEDVGGAQRPVGIAEQFASQQDEVGLPGGDDVLGLLGRGDHADGSSEDSGCLAADALGKGSLIAGAERNFAEGTMPPEEQSMRSTPRGLTCRARAMESSMVQPPSVQSEAEMRSHRGRRSGQTLRTASMISRRMRVRFSKAAAVLVGAGVDQRREKLVDEIAVGSVDFDKFEAGFEGAASGFGESVGDASDAFGVRASG
jgi:hypothetical protein